jgi:hypothetical protein
MNSMKEHFDIVNNSTLFSNYNQGRVIDPARYSIQQKIPQQLTNGKKIVYNYNNKNNFDVQKDISNYTSNQMGNKYGF